MEPTALRSGEKCSDATEEAERLKPSVTYTKWQNINWALLQVPQADVKSREAGNETKCNYNLLRRRLRRRDEEEDKQSAAHSHPGRSPVSSQGDGT